MWGMKTRCDMVIPFSDNGNGTGTPSCAAYHCWAPDLFRSEAGDEVLQDSQEDDSAEVEAPQGWVELVRLITQQKEKQARLKRVCARGVGHNAPLGGR